MCVDPCQSSLMFAKIQVKWFDTSQEHANVRPCFEKARKDELVSFAGPHLVRLRLRMDEQYSLSRFPILSQETISRLFSCIRKLRRMRKIFKDKIAIEMP